MWYKLPGVAPNIDMARHWFERAAEANDAEGLVRRLIFMILQCWHLILTSTINKFSSSTTSVFFTITVRLVIV
jgi:hypothetical protein